jgi:hypothetical protein
MKSAVINIKLLLFLLLNIFLLNVISDYRCADVTNNECDEKCMSYSTW